MGFGLAGAAHCDKQSRGDNRGGDVFVHGTDDVDGLEC
jgi:hypothetical protein